MAVVRSRVLNVEQAAEMIGMSRRWVVREGVGKRKLPYLRPPGSNQLLFLESDLWRTLDEWKVSDETGSSPARKKVR